VSIYLGARTPPLHLPLQVLFASSNGIVHLLSGLGLEAAHPPLRLEVENEGPEEGKPRVRC